MPQRLHNLLLTSWTGRSGVRTLPSAYSAWATAGTAAARRLRRSFPYSLSRLASHLSFTS